MIEFSFDETNPKMLRDKVNEIVDHMIKKNHTININNKPQISTNSWNQICGIMDRIQDTLHYINNMKLGNYSGAYGSCFDFYEFLMHVSVIIDSINWLTKIFEIPKEKIDAITNSSSCFHNRGYTQNGNDKKFFEYLRSLVVAHPVETSRHPDYIPKEDIMHICPFVLSSDSIGARLLAMTKNKKFDYDVVIYVSSNAESCNKHLYISINEIKKYLNKWINFLSVIVLYIDKYNNDVDNFYKQRKIKTELEFNNYYEYIDALIKESDERFDTTASLKEAKFLLECESTIKKNNYYIDKYKNAIKYGIDDYHKILQNIERDDKSSILDLVTMPPIGDTGKYNDSGIFYADEKTLYLYGTYSKDDEDWGREQMETHLFPIIKDMGLEINRQCPSKEYLLIYKTALYFKALQENQEIDNHIPQEDKYRII